MELKLIKPISFYTFSAKVDFMEMMQYVRVMAQNLYGSAIDNKLEITGPLYWIYNGMVDMESKFDLDICLPVTHSETESKEFKIKTRTEFKCVSAIHTGTWFGLKNTYDKLSHFMEEKGYQPSGENREIYINMDFDEEDNNITEVQIGIK